MLQKTFFIPWLSLFVIACSTNPSLHPVNSPESQGMSSMRLARIDTMMAKSMADKEIPGAVALVTRNGKTVYRKSFGIANPETQRAYDDRDIFRIASMTKAVTSLAVLMLWEEGKFFLDDPIENYIPEFKNSVVLKDFNPVDSSYTSVPANNKITIRHLLTHTSGLGYGVIDGNPAIKAIYAKAGMTDLFTTDTVQIATVIQKLAPLPLHHEPGERYTYSLGLDVLGHFVALMSGQSFDAFLQTRIFEPLGMQDTYFYLPETHHDRLVPILTKKADEWAVFHGAFFDEDYPKKGSGTFYSGGAGLSSTVEDYARFLQLFLDGGKANGYPLIGKKTCELLFSNQLKENAGFELGLAFGLLSEEEYDRGGMGSVGTLTWGGYFNTYYFADKEENIVGLIYKQTQHIGDDTTSKRFRELVFQAVVL
jgi:CubicO group peptidase (beta-lactamase class C family)